MFAEWLFLKLGEFGVLFEKINEWSYLKLGEFGAVLGKIDETTIWILILMIILILSCSIHLAQLIGWCCTLYQTHSDLDDRPEFIYHMKCGKCKKDVCYDCLIHCSTCNTRDCCGCTNMCERCTDAKDKNCSSCGRNFVNPVDHEGEDEGKKTK